MHLVRIKKVGDPYFDEAMHLYSIGFPPFEQRTTEDHLAALTHDAFHCMAICEKDTFKGILFYWQVGECLYIEHLAISPELRGQNYGSRVLKAFCATPHTVFLEIDPPVDEVAVRRLRFYTNLGFKLQDYVHIHPPFKKADTDYDLRILSFGKDLTQEDFDAYRTFLFDTIMQYAER